MRRSLTALTIAAVFVAAACAAVATPSPTPMPDVEPTAPATTLGVYGKVTDSATGTALGDVCVTIGIPGARCWGTTDAYGNYSVDMIDPWSASPGQFEVYFVKTGYVTANAPGRFIRGVVRIDFAMHK